MILFPWITFLKLMIFYIEKLIESYVYMINDVTLKISTDVAEEPTQLAARPVALRDHMVALEVDVVTLEIILAEAEREEGIETGRTPEADLPAQMGDAPGIPHPLVPGLLVVVAIVTYVGNSSKEDVIDTTVNMNIILGAPTGLDSENTLVIGAIAAVNAGERGDGSTQNTLLDETLVVLLLAIDVPGAVIVLDVITLTPLLKPNVTRNP